MQLTSVIAFARILSLILYMYFSAAYPNNIDLVFGILSVTSSLAWALDFRSWGGGDHGLDLFQRYLHEFPHIQDATAFLKIIIQSWFWDMLSFLFMKIILLKSTGLPLESVLLECHAATWWEGNCVWEYALRA